MIGFNFLGKMGQLGNQMFQFAALRGIAKNNGYNFCIPNHNEVFSDPFGPKLKIELFEPFVLKNVSILNIQEIDDKRPSVQESDFCFDENLFNNCPDWVNLIGYFQSEKYFKNIESEIREDFSFKDTISIPCKEMISEIKNPVSLHIRRKDFLTNPNHSVLELDYYQKALNQFDETSTVLVFSDDPEWCNQQEIFSEDRFLIAEGNSNYVDLCLMTLCSKHIIANSSFSWWGAWLSEQEKVVAPSGWFKGSNNEHLDTKDIIPENWMVI